MIKKSNANVIVVRAAERAVVSVTAHLAMCSRFVRRIYSIPTDMQRGRLILVIISHHNADCYVSKTGFIESNSFQLLASPMNSLGIAF